MAPLVGLTGLHLSGRQGDEVPHPCWLSHGLRECERDSCAGRPGAAASEDQVPSQVRAARRVGQSCPTEMPVPSSEAALSKHLLHASSLPCVGDTGHGASSMFGIPNTRVCAHRHTMTQRKNWDPQNSATTLHTLAPWEAGDESAPNSTH